LREAAEHYEADGVLAPVEPQLPKDAPRWIIRGRFYEFPHQPSGALVPLNRMRFGNVLLRASSVRQQPGPFDERYGLMAGEDGDLLVRLAHQGCKIVWSEEASICEPVERSRLSLRWLLRRAYTGGQEFGRQTVHGRYGPINSIGQQMFFLRVSLQVLIAAAVACISWPTGSHRAARWLIRTWANMGKLTAFWGLRSQAYD
jgi:succinoglycan biosynthesis protein ExoM